jgi:serine/threonine protein kinase
VTDTQTTGPDDSSIVGRTIDRYKVVRQLGAGAMGAVYEVEHLRLGKRFAMKVIHAELSKVEEFLARFDREATACSALDHPSCISVTDYGRTENEQPFLVMEYVKGQPLHQVLEEQGPLPQNEAIALMRDVLRGLDHAHGQGIIHRDIKLENVMMVTRKGQRTVKILDFGIAKAPLEGSKQLTQAGMVFGTPEYMAPEQTMSAQVDARADLYAVGVMLFALLTGKTPFYDAAGQVELLQTKLTQPAPPMSTVAPGQRFSPALEQFVAHALQREPSKRFSTAEEMIAELDRVTRELGMVPRTTLTRVPIATAEPQQAVALTTVTPSDKPHKASPLAGIKTGFGWWLSQIRSYLRDPQLETMPARLSGLVYTKAGRVVFASAGLCLVLFITTCAVLISGDRSAPTTSDSPAPVKATPSIAQSAKTLLGKSTTTLPPPIKDKRLVAARLLIAKKACREASIDLKNALTQNPKSAAAHYLLGAAHMCRYRYKSAMQSYTRAIEIDRRYGHDARVHADLTRISSRRPRLRKEVLSLIDKLGSAGVPLLVKLASESRVMRMRHAARDRVVKAGDSEKIDWVESLSLDLAQLPRCKQRLQVVLRLKELGDPRAIKALRKAPDAKTGFFRHKRKNWCARKEIAATITELQKKR